MGIRFELEEAEKKAILRALKKVDREATIVLRRAVNNDAKKVREILAKQVNKSYAFTRKEGGSTNLTSIKGMMEITKATTSNPVAIIKAKGPSHDLIDLKVTQSGKKSRVLKAKVLKASKLTRLEHDGIKAFITTFRSGHMAVVERVKGKKALNRKSGKSREVTKNNMALKSLYTISKPTMLGGEHGYKSVALQVSAELEKHVNKQMDRLMGGR